ncbi:hypothetical protein HMPREF9120_00962 [Neisseria sp. oral taxon 020 str. F0370]|nr:hypothetical protein HMPREF9120_00962 [Neisseria sp. oral taxon 020 str. F0370]
MAVLSRLQSARQPESLFRLPFANKRTVSDRIPHTDPQAV